MPQETLNTINGDATARTSGGGDGRHGEIIGSEYMGGDGRKAVQKVLYRGGIFTFTVACGNRQFAAADPNRLK